MKLLVTGNLGYIGSELGKQIKGHFLNAELVGCDLGLFKQCLTANSRAGDTFYDIQYYMDVRDITKDFIKGYDAVVCLAAVSNDPISKDFEKATHSINLQSSFQLAQLCVDEGVSKFVFASSCSMYGSGGSKAKIESDKTDPLTAYAKSKIGFENKIKETIHSQNTDFIFLRFSTACGISDRLRLDLVLNDFVAGAVKYKKIKILSDGSPLRPLIDVKDMCQAIIWAIKKPKEKKSRLSINIGSNKLNYSVLELAHKVKEHIPDTDIIINDNAQPDKRSYKVDFSLYKRIGGDYYPKMTIDKTIDELINQIKSIDLPPEDFSNSKFIRLNHLRSLLKSKCINKELRWI